MEAVGLVLAVLAGAACLFGTFSNLRRAHAIEDTPTGKVRSAPQGYIELTGLARPLADGPVYAPLTGTACVWYSYRVERWVDNSGRSGGSWKTVRKGSSERHFQLQDDTGCCLVQPTGAHFSSQRQRWYGDTPHPPHGPAERSAPLLGLGRRGYRYTEQRIHDGDWLYAAGYFRTVNPPSLEEQAEQRKKALLATWKGDRGFLLSRFDSDADGDISLDEWERARTQAADQAWRESLVAFDHTPVHFLSAPTDGGQPYLISSTDPALLARRFRRRAAMFAAVATALALVTASGAWRIMQ